MKDGLRRSGWDSQAAQGDSAANLTLASTLKEASDTAWRMDEVLRLHEMGLHPVPIRANKKPMIRWRSGDVDYVAVPPSVEELQRWAHMRPAGWGVTCGGPPSLLVLDIEGAGLNDAGEAGAAILAVLGSLPSTCQRDTPGGGRHAFLRVVTGVVPPGQGHQLIRRAGGDGEKPKVLLAEYRTEGNYAMVLGPGRGLLPEIFAVHPITRSELDVLLATLRSASPIPSQKPLQTDTARGSTPLRNASPIPNQQQAHTDISSGSTPLANPADRQISAAFQRRLHPGTACNCVQEVTNRALTTMAEGELTQAILGPVLSLLKLGARGHVGAVEALHEIEACFLAHVALRPGRSGGAAAEAQGQWDRSVDGAVRRLVEQGMAPRKQASCDCWLDRFMSAWLTGQTDRRSKSGQARITDTFVITYLVSVARRSGSRIVSHSQRQISEALDLSAKTIGRSVARLQKQLWVERCHSGTRADRITLLDPLVGGDMTAIPTTPERGTRRDPSGVVVVKSPHETHRMFGPKGLGPGVALTYAHLPEMRRRIGRRGLLAVGHRDSGRDTANMNLTRRPPAPSAPGLTNAELTARIRRDRSTIRSHLNKLAGRGMAFRDTQGRWWRYAVDLDAIADEDRIPHTRVIKKQRHDRERRAYYESRVGPADIARHVGDDGSIGYVDRDTGEFVWIDHDPPAPTRPADGIRDAEGGDV